MNLAQVINPRTLHVDPLAVVIEPPGRYTLAELLRIHLASIRIHERAPTERTFWPREVHA